MICFIPARGGSKSIPRKNIKELGNKPLIVWSIEIGLKLGLQTIVNTDDIEILDIARQAGAEVMYVSPIEARERNIHQDSSSMYQVLKSEIFRIKPLPDIVLLLQATVPLRNLTQVETAIAYFVNNLDNYDSLISVEKVPEKYNPAQIIVNINSEKRMAYFNQPISKRLTKRQDYPEAWIPSGSIYLLKTSNLEKGSIYGDKVLLFETESEININNMEDFKLCEQELSRK